MDTCCQEVEAAQQKQKICYGSENQVDYVIIWQITEAGKLVESMEGYLKGGKACIKMFDPEGNVLLESCQ